MNTAKENIKELIVEVRGIKVILASDLAKMFNMETKNLNRTVKRNIGMFNSESYFQITNEEYEDILEQKECSRSQNYTSRFQIGTLNEKKLNRGNNIKYLPYVFSIDGIEVLSTIIKSEFVRIKIKEIKVVFEEINNYEIIKKSPEIEGKSIRNMIYEINGIQVMMDIDLAILYECKNGTKEINQAVKNNIDKFPERFSWVLNDNEKEELRSKFLTTNYSKMSRSNPRVFTEQGIYMLGTILKTDVATKVSIEIMDTFVAMRHFIESNKDIYQNLININNKLENHNVKLIEHDNKFTELFSKFDKKEEKISTIFYKGQVFDAYVLLLDIFDSAKEEIIIIDNYAGKELLKILKNVDKKIIIISKNIDDLLIKKYNSEYSNIEFKNIDIFHDRFIIIDRKKLYSCGASFKDLGKKCFAINEMDSEELTCNLLNKIFN